MSRMPHTAGEEGERSDCRPSPFKSEVHVNKILRGDFLTVVLTQDRWTRTPVKRRVKIRCAYVDGPIDLENAVVQPEFRLENSHIAGGVKFKGARFERTVAFSGSSIAGDFDAELLYVGGELLIGNEARFEVVNLLGAEVRKSIAANKSLFNGKFTAIDIDVGGGIFMQSSTFNSAVRLNRAVIGSDLNAAHATFNQKLSLESSSIGNDLFLRGDATFSDVRAVGARVGAHIQLAGATFFGQVDLSRASAAELILHHPGLTARKLNPVWYPGSGLVLRNTTVDTLQAQLESWRYSLCTGQHCTWIPADLNGLVYKRLEGFRAGNKDTLLDATAVELVTWLKGVGAAYAQPEPLSYDPHPFEQLAAALDQAGMQSKARSVRFAKYVYRDQVQPVGWYRQYLLHPLARVSIGYGVYPFWALAWWVALVLVGFAVSHASQNAVIRTRRRKFWYSLERALPLIELSQTHRKIRHRNRWLDSYFNLHTVGGFVLATLLIGALSFLPG